MKNARFELTSYRKHSGMLTLHAKNEEYGYSLTVHFDLETGSVIYPVSVMSAFPGMDISLDSEESASCTLPPVIPGHMTDRMAKELNRFHAIVEQARLFIEEEKKKER